MLRLFAWVSLVVLVALPQQTVIKALRAAATSARVSQQAADSLMQQRGGAEPVEVGDDGDDVDGDDATESPSAGVAARLAPSLPRSAAQRAKSPRAGVLWSLAIQECGPPRA